MKILIVDDDVYLGMKVTTRLFEEGEQCTNVVSVSEIDFQQEYDTILLSTNLSDGECKKVIEKYKNSTIILLVTYISDATVAKPLSYGADDYILKPFSMDELIRKIKHFEEFKALKLTNKLYEDFISFIFKDIELNFDSLSKTPSPILIETNDQRYADKYAFNLAKKLSKKLRFVSSSDIIGTTILSTLAPDELMYITDFHTLKKASKQFILENIEKKYVVILSLENEEELEKNAKNKKIALKRIELKNPNQIITSENIMTINDYIKLIVSNFQYKYPDTELSKKLGISRKSLWEKRKKLEIGKKK